MIPNFYTHTIGGQKADYYRICLVFGITDPAIAHALKKLLRAGRSHKSLEQDVQDAIDTLKRWQEIQREDAPMVNTCGSTVKEIFSPVEPADTELFYEFFPVKPEWHREELANLDSWDGPGWYIVETNPFTEAYLSGPYLTRELAVIWSQKPLVEKLDVDDWGVPRMRPIEAVPQFDDDLKTGQHNQK